MRVDVAAFSIDRHNVTNGDYLEFVEATDATAPHFWTKQRRRVALARDVRAAVRCRSTAPVYVTHDEATRVRGVARQAVADRGRVSPRRVRHAVRRGALFPWGDELPDATRGNFGFTHWDPVPVGSYPAGASAWGVHDLVGNGWEWTSTDLRRLPRLRSRCRRIRVYSADFFDGKHYVMKGASPATPPELIRRSFRNWFRPNYPYVYATFRCAHD